MEVWVAAMKAVDFPTNYVDQFLWCAGRDGKVGSAVRGFKNSSLGIMLEMGYRWWKWEWKSQSVTWPLMSGLTGQTDVFEKGDESEPCDFTAICEVQSSNDLIDLLGRDEVEVSQFRLREWCALTTGHLDFNHSSEGFRADPRSSSSYTHSDSSRSMISCGRRGLVSLSFEVARQ